MSAGVREGAQDNQSHGAPALEKNQSSNIMPEK